MPYYESVFIARQEISVQQVDALAETFSNVISDGGGKVTKQENWGLKNLAYRIKKSRKAHYVLFNIDAPPDVVHEMERQMRLNEDVLRFITLRVNELDDEASIQAQNKSNQADDGEGNGEFKARTPEEMDDASKTDNNVTEDDGDVSQPPELKVAEANPGDDATESKDGNNDPS